MSVREGPALNKELQTGPPYNYIDYTRVATAAAIVGYRVGTAARTAEPGRYPQFFVAKRITVFCNQNFWLRLNNSRAVAVRVPMNTWMVFDVPTSMIYYSMITVAGTLDIIMQG